MSTTATISYLWTKGRKAQYLDGDGYPGYVISGIIIPQIRRYVMDKESFYHELLNSPDPLIDEEDMLSMEAEYRYEVSHLEKEWYLIETNVGKLLYNFVENSAHLFGWEDEEEVEDVTNELSDAGIMVKNLDEKTAEILERHGISIENEEEIEMGD